MDERLKEIIKESNNIVFFGGAGVSTASGIPDFRSADGLWNEKLKINFTPEQLVSHTFYMRYPEEFFAFYKDKLIYPEAKPNRTAPICPWKDARNRGSSHARPDGDIMRNSCG